MTSRAIQSFTVWFYFDDAGKICINTYRKSHKAQNIKRRNIAYFSVDEDTFPYRCVKGKARVEFSEDVHTNLAIVSKLMMKYLGSTGHPTAVQIIDSVKSGESIILELQPRYYSTWRFD